METLLKPRDILRDENGRFDRHGKSLAKTQKKSKQVNKRNAAGIGGFKPGQSGNPAGRPKGSQNKTTLQLKEAILSALEKLGGDDYLVALGRENSSAFTSLLVKMYPTTLAADAETNGGAAVKVEFRRILVWPGGREEEVDTPKALPAPNPALPKPTDPTDDTNAQQEKDK
jgi:hypothetical protein